MEFSEDLYHKMGLVLQLYGDYINLHNAKVRKLFIAFKFCLHDFTFKYATVRGFCDDLDEGKFNFPIIHAIQSHPNDHRLLGMLYAQFFIANLLFS